MKYILCCSFVVVFLFSITTTSAQGFGGGFYAGVTFPAGNGYNYVDSVEGKYKGLIGASLTGRLTLLWDGVFASSDAFGAMAEATFGWNISSANAENRINYFTYSVALGPIYYHYFGHSEIWGIYGVLAVNFGNCRLFSNSSLDLHSASHSPFDIGGLAGFGTIYNDRLDMGLYFASLFGSKKMTDSNGNESKISCKQILISFRIGVKF